MQAGASGAWARSIKWPVDTAGVYVFACVCGSVYGNSNAFAYGDGVDFDVDDSDSCVFGY